MRAGLNCDSKNKNSGYWVDIWKAFIMSQEATQPEVAAPVEETGVPEPSVPKKPKRTLTEKQRAALQQGRNKRWEKHNALVNSLKD